MLIRFASSCTIAVLFAISLMGCADINELLFGETTSPAQQAYQEKGKFVYVSIPVRNYLTAPEPNLGIKETVCTLERVVYDGSRGAAAAALSGGDEIDQVLASLAGGLASLSLEVFGQVVMPDPDELVHRSVILARVGAVSVAEMRIWRKRFVEVKANEFVKADRDPTEDEWAQMDGKVDEIHAVIREACGHAAPV